MQSQPGSAIAFGRRLRRAALGLALLLPASGCSLFAQPHSQGNLALQNGDYPAAIEAFSQAIDRGDHLIIAYINRGIAYEASGEAAKAVADYDAALALTEPAPTDQQRAEILNNRGVAYLALHERQKAMDDFDAAIELRPDYAEAFANRGYVHILREAYNLAIEDLDKALEINPDLAEAYGNRGLAYQNQGDDEMATRDFTRAINLGHDPQAYWNRGMLRYSLGCFNLAYEDFAAIVERVDDTHPIYYQAYNQKLFLEGRPKNEESCRGLESTGELDETAVAEESPAEGTQEDGSVSGEDGAESTEEATPDEPEGIESPTPGE